MEYRQVQSGLLALRKLYGLLLLLEDTRQHGIVQISEIMDDRARTLLKNLLDAATEKLLESHSQMITGAAKSGFPSTLCPSSAVQPKTLHWTSPLSSNALNVSLGAFEISSQDSSFLMNNSVKDVFSLVKPVLQEGVSEMSKPNISLQKVVNRKKRCRVCKQNSASVLKEDGIYKSEKPNLANGQPEGNCLNRFTGNEMLAERKYGGVLHEPNGDSSISYCSSSPGASIAKSGYGNSSDQIDQKPEQTASGLSEEVVNAIKRIESSIPYLQLCSETDQNFYRIDNSVRHVEVPEETAAKMHEVSNTIETVRRFQDPMDKKDFQTSKQFVKINAPSQVAKSLIGLQELACKIQNPNGKDIVQTIEAGSQSSAALGYQTGQHGLGLQVSPTPSYGSAAKIPIIHSQKMPNHITEDNLGRAGKWKPVRSRPPMPPKSPGSARASSHKKNLPYSRVLFRPTLLYSDSVNDHGEGLKSRKKSFSYQEEPDESTSSSSDLSNSWTSEPRTSIADSESYSSLSPSSMSRESTVVVSSESSTEDSSTDPSSSAESSKDIYPSREVLSSEEYRSPSDLSSSTESYKDTSPPSGVRPRKKYGSSSEKGIGRLKRLKNKLGFILHHHHHHHHHHHVNADIEPKEKGHSDSMWKSLHKTIHRKKKKKKKKSEVYENKAVDKLRKSAVPRNQIGHFHALVQGVMRRAKNPRKSKLSKAENKSSGKGWRGGIKMPNKGSIKLGFKSRKPQLKGPKLI